MNVEIKPRMQVEILEAGEWKGPFTVTAFEGRSPNHLVLNGPSGMFETYNDAPFNVRPVQPVEPASNLEIAIIHESNVGDDSADVSEYPAVMLHADEITRRLGCINYGAVSRISMQLSDFQRFLEDGKFAVVLEVVTTWNFRTGSQALCIVHDLDYSGKTALPLVDGRVDLSALGWEFYPASRYVTAEAEEVEEVEPYRSEYRNGGQQ